MFVDNCVLPKFTKNNQLKHLQRQQYITSPVVVKTSSISFTGEPDSFQTQNEVRLNPQRGKGRYCTEIIFIR